VPVDAETEFEVLTSLVGAVGVGHRVLLVPHSLKYQAGSPQGAEAPELAWEMEHSYRKHVGRVSAKEKYAKARSVAGVEEAQTKPVQRRERVDDAATAEFASKKALF
jgi:hypothetical protein